MALDVISGGGGATSDADEHRAAPRTGHGRGALHDAELDGLTVPPGVEPRLLPILTAQPRVAQHRDDGPAGGVAALHGAHPQIGGDLMVAATPVDQRVVRAQLLARGGEHPLPVRPDVGGQTLCLLGRQEPSRHTRDRLPAAPFPGQLQQSALQQDRDRVEVAGYHRDGQTLAFKRDGSPAGERVPDHDVVLTARRGDLLTYLTHQRLIDGGVPGTHPTHEVEQPGPLGILQFWRREEVGPGGWVIDELREQHGPGCRQRLARPPQVQGGGMPVPDRFLPRGMPAHDIQRHGRLDQLAAHAECSGSPKSRVAWSPTTLPPIERAADSKSFQLVPRPLKRSPTGAQPFRSQML